MARNSRKRQKPSKTRSNAIKIPESIDRILESIDSDSSHHAVLSYLRKHALGHKNAKPWKQILAHLKNLGFKMSKNAFQTGLLQASRKYGFFVASCANGFYLPKNASDFLPYESFMEKRIEGEQANLNEAKRLRILLEKVEDTQRRSRKPRRSHAAKRDAHRAIKATGKPRSKGNRPTRS